MTLVQATIISYLVSLRGESETHTIGKIPPALAHPDMLQGGTLDLQKPAGGEARGDGHPGSGDTGYRDPRVVRHMRQSEGAPTHVKGSGRPRPDCAGMAAVVEDLRWAPEEERSGDRFGGAGGIGPVHGLWATPSLQNRDF